MARRVDRTRSVVSAIAVAVLALGVTPANAHERTISTDIWIDDTEAIEGDRFSVTGHLTSPNDKCLRGRTVKLFAVESGTPEEPTAHVRTLLDTDRTSPDGSFYLEGDLPPGTDYFVVRVTRKNIGSSGHKHICHGTERLTG